MQIIIIGNSATAVGAIESFREYDQSAEITVVSEEPHLIYSRPLLSHFLGKEIERSRLAYRPSDFYVKHSIRPILEDAVTAVEPEAHTIRTASGLSLHYDKLLICTGGTPIVPPLQGIDIPGIYTFTKLQDALSIERYIDDYPISRAVVVGGGMIGIKAANALMKRGIPLTMVELAPRILSAAMDEAGSAMLTQILAEHSVQVLTNNTVTSIHQSEGRFSGVTLRDGRELGAELLVFGIGVRPRVELAKAAGLVVNKGIVVDKFMRASAPDIYAAGDVAEAYDLVVDMNRTVAIWPNAYRQGAIAGAHMAGVDRADIGGIAMNAVEVCGVPAMSIGNGNVTGSEYEVLSEIDERSQNYKRLVLQNDRLVGALLIGNISRAGIYTGLIRHKLDVSSVRKNLLSEHFGLLSLPDQYRKHVVSGSSIEI
ncbi:MAG: FAD-dependent oxidoreductase [Chloroflexi bacterium]|nr:FAD-dependent oxidoreductase [Chloroflexota bacterium]